MHSLPILAAVPTQAELEEFKPRKRERGRVGVPGRKPGWRRRRGGFSWGKLPLWSSQGDKDGGKIVFSLSGLVWQSGTHLPLHCVLCHRIRALAGQKSPCLPVLLFFKTNFLFRPCVNPCPRWWAPFCQWRQNFVFWPRRPKYTETI